MGSLQWTSSNAVFVTEIDDEHQEIFEAVSSLQKALTSPGQLTDISAKLQHLVASIVGHFAHEERLMRAARYGSLRWHVKLLLISMGAIFLGILSWAWRAVELGHLTGLHARKLAELLAQSSYLSVNDGRPHFGPGSEQKAEIEIHWPNGKVE